MRPTRRQSPVDRSVRGRRAGALAVAFWMGLAAGATAQAPASETSVQRPLREAAVALQKGDLDGAIQLYGEALADRSLSSDRRAVVHTDRGAAAMRRGLFKAAIEDFNRAIQLSPEYAPAYNNRGNALVAVGAPREALKDFDRALLLSPNFAAAYANRGTAQVKLGQTDAALVDFTRAIELSPTSAAPFNGRGLVHLSLERPHAASRDFSRALELDTRFAAGYRNRAAAKILLDRTDDVIEDLSRAIAFDARHVDSYLLRADAYLAAENAAGALRDYNRAIELAPRSAPAIAGRAYALARSGAMEDALADLARAVEYEPKLARAYAVRAWVYKQTQQLDLAQKDLDRALKLEPLTADAVWAQGEIEEARGRLEPATTAYTRALGLAPRHRPTLDALSRLNLVATRPETEVPGAAVERWRVLQSGDQFVAVNEGIGTLRVPLEVLGRGQPRLLSWQRQPAPHQGFGLLRFSAGRLEPQGQPAQELETVAIVDLTAASIVGMPLGRKGATEAQFSWEDARLVVTAADGLTEEFTLRGVKGTSVAGLPGRATERREGTRAANTWSGQPVWAPWAQGPGGPPQQRQASRPPKQKSLFEMLFGN